MMAYLAGAESFAFELAGVDEDRPALVLKSGSRGKIRCRWRQGRMASSDSHCQMVEPEMLATRPRLMTSAWMSDAEAGDWQPELRGQLARDRLERDEQLRGEKAGSGRTGRAPPGPPSAARRTVCAIC